METSCTPTIFTKHLMRLCIQTEDRQNNFTGYPLYPTR